MREGPGASERAGAREGPEEKAPERELREDQRKREREAAKGGSGRCERDENENRK